MPAYPWLLTQKLDTSVIADRLRALRKTGVPYTDEDISTAARQIEEQSKLVTAHLAEGSITNTPADREIVALIAYLQRLGTDIKAVSTNVTPAVAATEGTL